MVLRVIGATATLSKRVHMWDLGAPAWIWAICHSAWRINPCHFHAFCSLDAADRSEGGTASDKIVRVVILNRVA
jgi:hypothetical protein